MITMGFLHWILTRVGSAFTFLNMKCWKLELTKIVNRNANYSFFELVRQKMRFKLPQWHILFFVICSQSHLNLKWSYSKLIKAKAQNEQMILFIIATVPHPSRKENPKMYSCGELVWNDPIGLLDIAHKWKTWHLCPGGGALTFFSGRGVRPGFPKCGACELTFASEKWGLWAENFQIWELVSSKFLNLGAWELKIFKFGGLWAKIWVKIEAVEVKISKFSQKRVLWTDSFA